MQDCLLTHTQESSIMQQDDSFMMSVLPNIDNELSNIQEELNKIAIDVIPFDKVDAVFVFCNSIIGILLDFFMDPTNAKGLSYALNNKNNKLGEWCNSVHESINHKNNPMDFQGGHTKDGEIVINGSGIHRDISFGGGNHRVRTYDHDILRFWHAIKDYHDGIFRDGGYVGGKYIEVVSNVNSNGVPFDKLSWGSAFVKYCSHMFADFFSTKGLPCPGASFLSHASNRELRILASETYKGGLNMRTQVLQTIPFVVMDAITAGYVKLRYLDDCYSDEAQASKKHLLQLMTNGLVSAINIGKVIITEQPQRINLPVIIHTLRLVATCVLDKVNYNQRVVSKMSLDSVKTQLLGLKTYICIGQDFCIDTQDKKKIYNIDERLQEQLIERNNISEQLNELIRNQNIVSNVDYFEMKRLTENIPIVLEAEEQLYDVLNNNLVVYCTDNVHIQY